jgi:hypothetical protein
MTIAYLLLNLREGDMVSILHVYHSRETAVIRLRELMEHFDSTTTWWKILNVEIQDNTAPGFYDAVVRVNWNSSNRIKFIGLFQENTVPDKYDKETYFSERVQLD